MLFLTLFFSAFESENLPDYSITEDGLYEYIFDEQTNSINITNILKNSENLVIPSTIRHGNTDHPVNNLVLHGNHAGFLTGSLTIPNTITFIGEKYFLNQGISSLLLGNDIAVLSDYCFYRCTNLTCDITFPSSLEKIGSYCFSSTQISSITFSENSQLKIIGSYAFSFIYHDINSITFPSLLEEIGEHAFGYSYLRGEIKFPSSLRVIDKNCFYNTLITTISFENSTTDEITLEIRDSAFSYCYFLAGEIEFPSSLVKIGAESFCFTRISSIIFRPFSKLTIIGSNAFSLISFNKSIEFPPSLQQICSESFSSSKIPSITFQNSNLTRIDNEAFKNAQFTSVYEITFPSSLQKIGANSFEGTNVQSIIFREDSQLQIISSFAFSETDLTGEINFPSSLIEIGYRAFNNLKITSITFPTSSNIKYINISAFESSTISGTLNIPSSLELIDEYSFKNTQITSLNFPSKSNLKYIKSEAFHGTLLTGEINFPSALIEIGSRNFQGSNITSISLNDSISIEIGYDAFLDSSLDCNLNFHQLQYIRFDSSSFMNTNIGEITFPFRASIIFGSECFRGCKKFNILSSISAVSIQDNAFYECVNLKGPNNKITIYKNKYIYQGAFYGCSSLEEIHIVTSNDNRIIYENAFSYCSNLKTITIESTLTYNRNFISNCDNLETLNISGKNEITNFAIRNCPSLTEITLINATYIFESSLTNFNSLKKITFINSNITFKQYSFSNCPSLKSIILDENSFINKIESFAFDKCSSLEFDCSKVLSIESYAFQDSCDQSFTFYSSIIPSYSIKGSSTLKYIRIAPTVTKICAHFIERCNNFMSLEFLEPEINGKDLIIDDEAFWKMDTFELSSRLPKRLITIGRESFSGCTKITGSLIIPPNLISIGSNAFANCNGLNGILDFSNSTKLEMISSYAFLGCTSLSGSLVLPNSLKEIGAYAFSNCKFAGPLKIPNNVQIINQYAFALCSSFTGSLIIGDKVEYIGEYAFSECKGFNGQLEIHTKILKEIGNNAFFSCASLKGTLNLPNTLIFIGDFAFFDCRGLENQLILPESLIYIGDSAFAYCAGFTQILTFPKNISYIGRNAFLQCKGFTKIYFDEETSKNESIVIGDKAFGNLAILCLTNVPKTCKGNTSNNRCYDSTGFNSMQQKSSIIAESCELNTALEVLITLFGVISATGVFGIISAFVKDWFNNIYTVKKRITAIFETIIKWAKDKYEKERNENEIIQYTINEIQKYIRKESKNPKFNLNEKKLKDLLEAAFTSIWSSVPYDVMSNVLENCFNGIDFEAIEQSHKLAKNEKCCSCLKRIFKRESNKVELNSLSGAEINMPII